MSCFKAVVFLLSPISSKKRTPKQYSGELGKMGRSDQFLIAFQNLWTSNIDVWKPQHR